MSFLITKSDFLALKKIKSVNNSSFDNEIKNRYDNETIAKRLKVKIQPIKEKFNILEEELKNDIRFINFEIGKSSIRPRGFRFNSYFWVWMVEKKRFNKLNNSKVITPQLRLPQIQISLSPLFFKTAEIWFEKGAFEDRLKMYNFINKNKDRILNKYDIIVNKPNKNGDIYLSTQEGESKNTVLRNFNNKYYPEAGIRLFTSNKKVIKSGTGIIDKIKSDLYELILNVYEPVYGKVLDNRFDLILRNDKLRNEDDITRKGTQDTKYERKHFKMQNKFKTFYENKGLEVHIEKKRIDAIIKRENVIELIEMKPNENVQQTIREALGQIISYNYIFNNLDRKDIQLTIAGIGKPKQKDLEYIKYLKNKIRFHLKYLYFDYRKDKINPEYF
jgi:hypothetical protein